MKRTEQGLRNQIARRIIQQAYGIDPKSPVARIIRYELIGDGVAVILYREGSEPPTVGVRVAQRLPSGRVKRLRGANRRGVIGYREVVEHLEMLYCQYGGEKET